MFAQRIRELRKSKQMTQRQLADLLYIDCSTVTKWETGKANPDFEKQQRLASLFNVSIDYLLGREDSASNPKGGIRIPVLGSVVAGIPIEAVQEILDYEEITPETASRGEHFALKIKGDSMEPKFSAGDIVIIRKQPDVENGEIAIVLVNGDEATIKKIQKSPEGIALIPLNPQYEVMFYTNKEIETLPVSILGKVIELRAKF